MSITTADHREFAPASAGRSRLKAFLADVVRVLAVNRSMTSRMASITRLQAMSDEQLAAMGVKRDQIVHYVFRDIF